MILVYFKNLSIFIQLLWDLNTPRWLGLYHCYRCIFLLHFYYTFGHIFLLHFFSTFYWKLQKAIAKSYAGVFKKNQKCKFHPEYLFMPEGLTCLFDHRWEKMVQLDLADQN